MRARLLTLFLALALWPGLAAAQYATLIADRVRTVGADTLVAEGNVEVLYEGRTLRAARIVYDGAIDRLTIEGPITLIDATGAVVTASAGALDGDLRAGLLRGARVVLDEQVQIAATEFNRVDGRYNQLYKAVASSCQVCDDRAVPLWQIRARRVIHDQEERQLYFDHARFEVMGVPVAYFPRLRLPDPTLRRATGFLIPELRTSSALGTGIKVPYFVAIGDHADLTLTPYVSADTRTLQMRYRQAFRFGEMELNGAVSRDDLRPGDTRAYLFGRARFNLPGDFKLNLDAELTSDTGYLLTYGYSDKDRLSTGGEITRTRRDEYISAELVKLRTLRESEVPIEDALATLQGAAIYERRLFPAGIGGEGRLRFSLSGFEREADAVTPALAAECAIAGVACTARDVMRAGVMAGWGRDFVLSNGMIAGIDGTLEADSYWIGQDATFASPAGRVTPTLAADLRWPLARTGAGGVTDVIEPVMQIAWSDSYGDPVPNEDSQLVEFDEGNLLALSRFPGEDVNEEGWRATLGFSWSRFAPGGNAYALSLGRVIRSEDLGQFSAASGLDGRASDWLVAGQVRLNERLSLSNRSLFDADFDFAKSETRLNWTGTDLSASTSYIWLVADAAEGRASDTSEWNMDGAYRFDRHWTGTFNWRFDVEANRAAEAGIGLEYRNECLSVDLSLKRRFTSSTVVEPTTDVGLRVTLNGFGNDGRPHRRSCATAG